MLPRNSVKRMMKQEVSRMSKESVDEMKEVLEFLCRHLVRKAHVLSSHANKKTVRTEDLKLAISQEFPNLKFPEKVEGEIVE